MSQPNERFQTSDLKSSISHVMDDYLKFLSKEIAPARLSTGYSKFDEHLGGLETGLHLLGSRSRMGKTTLMLNITSHVCFEQKVPSLIYSMKLRSKDLMRRILFTEAHLDPFFGQRSQLVPRKFELLRLKETADKIAASRLFIEENISFRIDDLINSARQHKEENHIGFIAVDNLQLLRSDPLGPQSSSKVETLDVVSKLKRLALELKIPILLTSNIPSKSSHHKDVVKGLPLAHHIRHHDAIDGYLDTITTLYQPKYYTQNEGQFISMESLAKLTICKSPCTSFDQVDLHFDKTIMRFFEADQIETEE